MSGVHKRRRQPRESGHSPHWQAPIFHAIQARIGKELGPRLEVPQKLPHRLLTFLMQLDEQREQQ
jgi:hypothetical protein